MTVRGHGGMACMAQEYHGGGDVNGLLHKIGNVGVIDVNERTACYARREIEGLEVTRARGRMVSWLHGVTLSSR
jgi:hypothetical protein